MPRPLRIHVPGALYHVTLRGNHRRDIFFTVADREALNALIADVLERFAARLHAYCYMTNHLHLLVQVGDAPLGRLMLRIASRHARAVQARLHTTGHLFERRYHTVLVDADQYLLELLRYIHLNPVRARVVTHPADYPWSSHHVYLGSLSQPWVTTELALRMFHRERVRAIAAYARFIESALGDVDHPSPLAEHNPNDARILGSDDFAAKLLGAAWQPKSRRNLADLIRDACQRFCVTEEALRSRSSQRTLTTARAWIAYQAATKRVASLSEVARMFARNEASLRESVKRHFHKP
jgi:putative transposase